MIKIENIADLNFTNWENILVDHKNIKGKWGKTYFYVREGALYYANLSWIKRIFYHIFCPKKIEQEKIRLWSSLKDHHGLSAAYPEHGFRQQLARVLKAIFFYNFVKDAKKEED